MEFTTQELMITAAAQEINNHQVIFVGTGLPMLSAYLAKATHAPDARLLFEAGIVDPSPKHLASGVGDFRLMNGASTIKGLYYALGLLQSGHVDLGFLGAGEIDKFGNVNTTFVGGSYQNPKLRFPGSGGANDIASLSKETVIIVPHNTRKLVQTVQYITSPGYITGKNARTQSGLRGKGPKRVITDLAVLSFDPESLEMKVETMHKENGGKEIKESTGFDIHIPENCPVTPSPEKKTLRIIRSLDPDGIYIN